MKPLSIFSTQKSTSSQILCCALERSINIQNPTKLGRKGLKGSQLTKAIETMTVARVMGSPRQACNRRWGPARVPNLRVCKHLHSSGWHMQGVKDELTSCRGTVWSAWQKPPVSREGGRAGLPRKGEWPPRGTGTTVLTSPGSAPK